MKYKKNLIILCVFYSQILLAQWDKKWVQISINPNYACSDSTNFIKILHSFDTIWVKDAHPELNTGHVEWCKNVYTWMAHDSLFFNAACVKTCKIADDIRSVSPYAVIYLEEWTFSNERLAQKAKKLLEKEINYKPPRGTPLPSYSTEEPFDFWIYRKGKSLFIIRGDYGDLKCNAAKKAISIIKKL